MAAFAAIFALAVAAGYLQSWPPLATVMSGSMSPTIDTGDVVVIRHLPGMPRVGDIVAVTVPDAARSRYGYPPEVIHRIVRITPSGRITTKGDAKPRVDPFTVARSALRGQVVATIPAAGQVLAFLTSTLGLLWIAGGVLMLVVLPRIERQRELRQADVEEAAALHATLGSVSEDLAQMRAELVGLRRQLEPRAEPEPEPEPDPEPEPEPEPEPQPTPTVLVRSRSGGLVGAVAGRPGRRRRRSASRN